MSDDISGLKEAEKAPTSNHNQSWIVGLLLIAAGGYFLLSNFITLPSGNWWALFILIPGLANFGNAWHEYQQHGRLNSSGRTSLIWGSFFVLLAGAFFFDVNWDYIWPVFLILGGVAILIQGCFR